MSSLAITGLFASRERGDRGTRKWGSTGADDMV
jgi:hypothetical protein